LAFTTLHHYYGLICNLHLVSLSCLSTCSALLFFSKRRYRSSRVKSICLNWNPSVLTQQVSRSFGLSHLLQGYPPVKPSSVRFRYVPNSTCGFLHTLSSPTTHLPSASLPIGSAVNVSFNIPAQLTCPANNKTGGRTSACFIFYIFMRTGRPSI